MKCEHLQEILYDYLDDSLSPSERAAAERHLAGCLACREAVQRECQLTQALTSRLEQAVETVALDPIARRNLAAAVGRKMAESREQPRVSWWHRWVLPLAATAVILTITIWMGHHFAAEKNSPLQTARLPKPADDRATFVHLSYSVPGYIFRREGNRVVDALTSDAIVADGALEAKN